MPTQKVLGQAGISLADAYDVEGSIVGVDELDAESVKAVHEMGGQMFSERLQAFIIDLDSTAVLQTVTWDIEAGGIPDSPNRILGISVIATNGSRVSNCCVVYRDSLAGGEIPLFTFDATDHDIFPIRIALPGDTPANLNVCAGADLTPSVMTRIGAANSMGSLFFRGLSTTFGAGTVQAHALVHIARANAGAPPPGAPSSHGLPLPGW